MKTLSRRSALKGLGVLAGGIGVSSAGIAFAGGDHGPETSPVQESRSLVLYGSDLRKVGRAGRVAGEQLLIEGDLLMAIGGASVGRFFSTSTLLDTPSRFRPSVGSLALQTFSLHDGNLVGTGTLDHDGTGALAVTGGTGAFHGARGSYQVSQAVGSFGGGHAIYTFTLLTSEARF